MFASSAPAWQVAAFAPTTIYEGMGLAFGVGDVAWSDRSESGDEGHGGIARWQSLASSSDAGSQVAAPQKGHARRGRRSEAGIAKRRARQEERFFALAGRMNSRQTLEDSPGRAQPSYTLALADSFATAAHVPSLPVPMPLWSTLLDGYSAERVEALLLSAMPDHYEE